MKFSTATTSAVLLSNAALLANAFGPPPPSFAQRTAPPQRQTRLLRPLNLINIIDPILVNSAMESTSIVTSFGDVAEVFGSLALLGSVGFGVFSGLKDPDWSYEYKVGNDAFSGEGSDDLALLGESPVSVLEKVEEETAAARPKPAAVVEEPVAVEAAEPEPVTLEPVVAAATTAKPAIKANVPSKELLESTEKAKAVVQKKGVQETKEKMSSKSNTPSPPTAVKKEVKATSSTEVAESKKKGGKRRFAKGITLVVAAGAVAVARNVVKAYLGRGML
mmetsp:Transcript_19866/g.43100  ORF Transcript_19866/g.43100 Transcript_19866/m.43100 type:complete len:277 (+) Transcript_19866:317-1147(+)